MSLTNFTMCTLEGWMVNSLHLRGNDLIAFAAINQCCSYPEGAYELESGVIEDWLDCTPEETKQYIQKFLKLGIIKPGFARNEFQVVQ